MFRESLIATSDTSTAVSQTPTIFQ